MIQSPILGGSGQITGSFTTQTANNLAILLRAGALPAPLNIIEERTVGAELGADSIKAGRYSAHRGPGAGGAVHGPALRPVRPVRRYRADPERGAAAGGADRCSAPP